MKIDVTDEPIHFQLYGLSSAVQNRRYGEVGCRLMDQMWDFWLSIHSVFRQSDNLLRPQDTGI